MKTHHKLQNVDLTNVKTGKLWAHRAEQLIVKIIATAFTLPGVVLFITGVLFALTMTGRGTL